MLHVVIRNTLIDELRRTEAFATIPLDEQFVPLPIVEEPKDGPPATAQPSDREGKPPSDLPGIEDELVDEIDGRILRDQLLGALDPKYREVVVLLLAEWSPQELEQAFGQDGYRLRHWARVKVCRALAALAAAANKLAAEVHARGGCPALLKSVAGKGMRGQAG